MKVAIVHNKENDLSPLDLGEIISIVDTDEKKVSQYENPGFERIPGGKEIAMATILRMKPDALVVKDGMMCPGSYRMSMGRIKFAYLQEDKLDDVLPKLESVDELLADEAPMDVYREDE
jgi:hypothetical protein